MREDTQKDSYMILYLISEPEFIHAWFDIGFGQTKVTAS